MEEALKIKLKIFEESHKEILNSKQIKCEIEYQKLKKQKDAEEYDVYYYNLVRELNILAE